MMKKILGAAFSGVGRLPARLWSRFAFLDDSRGETELPREWYKYPIF
jgi:hypothetical protein